MGTAALATSPAQPRLAEARRLEPGRLIGAPSPPLPGRKRAVFDAWSALAVHVAMDNTVVMADVSE